jgi:4-hydroxy-tetrahydrodipicolinate reductase
MTRDALQGVDVALEFSTPHTAAQNIQQLAMAGVNAAVGTTGWLEHLPAVRRAVAESGIGLVLGS